jgi:ABC-type sugar transport system, periplasmic component
MKRLIAAALIVAAAALSLSAEKVPLKFLYFVDATQPGYDVDQAIWAKFRADNPDIDLQMEELYNEPYHQKFQAYVAAGTLPDVWYCWPSGRMEIVFDKHLAKDLAKLLPKSFFNDFSPLATDPTAFGDSTNPATQYQATIPQAFTVTTTCFVNAKLLKDNGFAVPKTYAELKRMVPRLKAKGVSVLSLPDKDKWPAQSCLFSTICGRMAGDAFIDKVKAGKAKFTDKDFMSALTFWKQLFDDGLLAKEDMNIDYNEGKPNFASGKAAIYVDGDWGMAGFITDKASGNALISPTDQEADFAVVNFPAMPGEKFPGVASGMPGVGYAISASIPSGSAKEQAAIKLFKYIYSPEVQKKRLETGAYVPTLKGIKADVEPMIRKVSDYKNTLAKCTYVLDGVLDPSIYNVLNDGLQAIGLGTRTPEQVAADMQKAADAWLAAKK